MVRETRHLWVGNLPENVREEKIIEHFKRYGRVESVKILPKRGSEGGVAAFVDFVDIKSAQKAHNSVNKMGDRDLRTDYNEPGTIPSAARGLDDTVSIASRSREVSGFRGGGGGPAYGPPPSLHAREGRYERRLDGASDNRERAYEHSAYGHHERGTGGFDRTRHYDQDYYRDPRERTLQHGLYYTSRSRSPNRFDAHDPRYEPRAREQFTLPSVVHRDIYRDDITREVRGRRPERNYQHSRSRSPHSSQSRNQSPQRLASQASRPTRSPSGSGSRSRSSSSDSISSSSSTSSDSTDSSSSSSDDSPARSVQSAAVPAPTSQLLSSLEKDEPRKSFGIKVQNLPVRSTDTSLKDGLFHEFKKFGKVTSVQIHGTSEERYGLVFFRQQEDQEKALTASKGKLFFGMQIEVTAWIGPETESENEFRPLDERIDEFHPKATRTLFIGNLEKTTTYHDLRNIFQRFGEIVDIDIKKVNGVPQYAFLQYCDIASVCKAIKKMDGEYLGNNRLKVDFANRESQLAFYHCMEKSGQDIRDFYEMLAERREERRGSYDYSQDRTYYENVRTPGTYAEDSRRDYPARGREFYSEWETYQGDYYESRYYDDPREYRDYRNDPYEQDIREYSYRQRERERERERFESDRDRDHERRPIERSQSPVHLRRPQSPGASPSQSERLPSDSERRIYSRSSDRSGSCSSLSPPRYDKLDKPRLERYTKNEKTDKERTFDPERVERERRLIRKEKVEKDKTDKQKRKGKVHSPSSQSSETDQENEREQSPEKSRSSNKLSREKADKEGVAKNRLELMPCVVLTRVKEKEGKVIDHTPLEKLKAKLDNDTVKSSALDQKLQVSQTEPAKSELSKLESVRMKAPKERGLSSHIEVVDKEGRPKPRKHLKPEQTVDGVSAVDLEKLEARKRRFADSNLKAERQKSDVKKSSPEMEDARVLLKKQPDISSRDVILLREGESEKKTVRKEVLKREPKKIKLDRLNAVPSPKECQELAGISAGTASRPGSDLQARLREAAGESVGNQEIQSNKPTPSKPPLKQLELLDDQGPEREDNRKNYCSLRDEPLECKSGQDKPHSVNTEEKIGIDIDHTQSYRKQMEQSRRKQQMEMEIAKSEKFGSPKKDVDEYERRSLVHEVGKPPQDVTDDSPPSKKKRMDHVDFDICTKRERNYRSSRQISEDSERTGGSPSIRHGSFHEDDDPVGSPRVMSIKGSPKVDEKGLPYSNITVREESLKFNPYDSSRREQMADMAKIKLSVLNPEDELNRWDSQMKQDASRFDVSFPNSIIKRDSLRKRSVRDLEPGEVPSDSDEDGEHKSHSPRASALFESSRLSFLLRDREDKLRERDERLSSSLERNKFYSFALDKTITPDTKALLERAKSLSSSREENWSFLDWDSRFANFRNNKDKEKVDSAPRPIPSWYMKKKKIRTDSEGKMDDKKDDHKEEEQERQELFASRFLHSSIFEQDSKRLQHLERKDEESDFVSGRLYGRQTSDGVNSTTDLIQEPVVLFHSRFMELTRMQQKEKEKDQKPKEAEKQEDTEDHPKTPESASENTESELKTPPSTGPPGVTAVAPESAAASLEKTAGEKTGELPSVTEEKTTEPASVSEEAKPVSDLTPIAVEQPEQVDLPPGVDTRKDVAETPLVVEESSSVDQLPYLDAKPPTPGASFSQVEISVDPEPDGTQTLSKPTQKPEEADEPKVEKPDSAANVEPNASQKAEDVHEVPPPATEGVEVDPPVTAKDKKPNKSKRSKTPIQAAAASIVEKPVTRKSERIDREKLKRSSSPRGEAQKLLELKMEAEKITRAASKNSSMDPEHPEPSLPLSRTRRRNVRSVYATMGDHESRSPVKEPVEQPRVTRKRLERELQEAAVVPTTPRRGRPPKTRRRADEDDETEAKEPVETVKPAEGWRSPRSQKVAAGVQQGKKGKNEPKVDAERPEATTEVSPQLNVKESNTKSKTDKEEAGSEQKRDRKEMSTDKNPPETPPVEVVEKKTAPEKNSKSKRGRSRNSRSAVDKSANLRNVEATVSPSVAAGPSGLPAEAAATVVAVSPEKSESPQEEGSLSLRLNSEPADLDKEPEKEDGSASKPSPEANQLAKQMELEQAVENIEKLAETSTPTAFKAAAADAPEGLSTEDRDKPAHQASETELAAAIGSIINDISGEPENFPAPPPYPTESQTDLQSPEEGMEPETDEAVSGILETEAATESSRPPGSAPDPSAGPADTKEARENSSETSHPVPEVKGSKEAEVTLARKDKGRQKTTRSRRKRNTNKKTGGATETHVSEPDQVQSKSPATSEGATIQPPETPQEEKQSDKPQSTPPESCASDPSKTTSQGNLSQESSVEEKTPTKASALPDLPPASQPAPVDDEPRARFKVHSIIESDPVTPPSDSSMPTPPIPSVTIAKLPPPVAAGGIPHQSPPTKVTEWITRQEEPRAQSTPSPALPPDTKASDVDTSSSTLRKILMDPKYVSATGVTSTSVTTAIAEPVSAAPCLHEALPPPVESKKPLLEEKAAAPVTNTSDTQASEVPVATDKEKVTPVIAPKITSVISRMPVSIDLENSQKITLAKPAPQTLTGLVSALTGLVNVSLVPVNALAGPVNALKGPVKGSVATLKGLVNTPAGPVNVLKGPVNVLTGPVNVLTAPVNAATGTVNTAAGAVTVSAGAVTAASGVVTAATTGAVTVAGAVIAPSAKCRQRSGTNDNSRFHPGSMSVIDDRPADTGSGAGLRVNTSEGVVLLSYSGQKTEGPQRISAKISQIPPASAMDIEFQQSVSKSQAKPDSVTPSQPPPKGPQAPSGYANVATHSTLVLTAQTYNASPVISSVKADRPSLEKPEPIHLSVSTPVTQGGTVKVLTQGINTPPVLVHNQLVLTPSIVTTNKKLADPVTLKIETKVLQPANLGSTLTPHHPPALPSKLPAEVNHVTSGPSTPTDRTVSHLAATKPDVHSPRPSGPAPSPFPRACHPSSTTSAALSTNATVMLAAGIPVPQFISSIHPEQSVIMPPHSITQTVSLSHLSQGEVRMNTPTLPSITYSIRPETLHSPRAPLQPQQIEVRAPQRAGTPQPAAAGVPALASQHPPEEEVHYHLPVARAAAPVQSEVLVMQSEYRLHPYTVPRDVRIMVHPHVTAVSEQPRAADGVVKVPPASKAPQQPGKEAAKVADAKAAPAAAPAPHGEARILTVTPSNQLQGLPLTPPVVVTHGVQIVHSSGELFQEYRYGDIRTYHGPAQLAHAQFPAAASIGLPSRTKGPAQGLPPEGEPSQPLQPAQSIQPAQSTQPSQLSQPGQPPSSKMPPVSQEAKGTQTGVEQPRLPNVPGNRPAEPHAQVHRAQAETSQTSYPSPVSVSMKPDLPAPLPAQAAPKQPLFVPTSSGPSPPPGLALPHTETQAAPKQDSSPHLTSQRPVDMVQLLKKYPIVWQGLLALKNDTAAVQLHFVSGNNVLAHRSLPLSEGGPPLRIAQRMRLEASQLEGVARRMTVETDYCLLLALPCGRDQEDVVSQTESLKAAFITYLQAKQAAGIINVPNPGSNQPAYVLQIFPPCEFSESHLSRLAPDLLASISNISPHLMIVIASV
ncbi:msx2-interacting protein isoform X2 [Physeter macrocephalus]|uniref:Msx2-interacting protein n=1 Tax=Physeter macrocephalus TaxID=9755 RepID=A0A2Y9SZH4_PHYMC|nr:msx2-interacting protein isoform X2 [Physeter catodon]|eukprot:XP_023981214.1 msx2-interacting protein isoform X2 [Physeter catodon]